MDDVIELMEAYMALLRAHARVARAWSGLGELLEAIVLAIFVGPIYGRAPGRAG